MLVVVTSQLLRIDGIKNSRIFKNNVCCVIMIRLYESFEEDAFCVLML